MERIDFTDDMSECRLYIGNLDLRITEASLIKMFSPFGKLVSVDFLWHTRGPKRGEPRGFAFIQYSTKEEARLAKGEMHGRLAGGRALVVRLTSEKHPNESPDWSPKGMSSEKHPNEAIKARNGDVGGGGLGQMSRSTRIAAIKSKLKALEDEGSCTKKRKHIDNNNNKQA